MTQIFLSYAKSDLERLLPLRRALARTGFSVFWDRDIPAGASWRTHIAAHLEAANCVVVAWSFASIKSQWVLEEAEVARARQVLLPILIDGVEPPLGFKHIQTVDLNGWDGDATSSEVQPLLFQIQNLAGSAVPCPPNASKTHNDSVANSEPSAATTQYVVVLSGTIDINDKPLVEALLSQLQNLARDSQLTLRKVERGSTLLFLAGTSTGYQRLLELRESGQLGERLNDRYVEVYTLDAWLRTSGSRRAVAPSGEPAARPQAESRIGGTDQTPIGEAEHEAQANPQRFIAAFRYAAAGMAIVRPDGRMMQVNGAFSELLGIPEGELVGKAFAALLHSEDAELFERHAAEMLGHRGRSFSIELRLLTKGGHDLWASLHCSHFDDPGQTGTCLIYQLHDISSRRLAESRLQHIAFHDTLTDLANRHFFEQRLAVAVERGRRDVGRPFAVIFLDLDRFKLVNNSLGHVAGNHLLREVARRLVDALPPDDLVARLGGDEFAVLLEGPDAPARGRERAARLLAALGQPLVMHGTEVLPTASIGITFSGDGPRSVDEVLRDAELAMYAAKDAGRGRVLAFDSVMHERIADKLALEADLRRAIGAGQLTVMFQPIYDLEPYRLYGFEALARWVHPERGVVSPSVFVTLAEESGHIEALSAWVVDHAVQQLATWQRAEPRFHGLCMHVNISGRDLQHTRFVTHVQNVLGRHGVAPAQLALEITEATLMGQLDTALASMHRLHEIGVRFSIDDFGTGYSSLAYLGTLPIDSLKIDRSFVMHMETKPQDVVIVRAVMNLGTSLGKRVVAEGIETAAQLAQLRALGVPSGQGFLLSPPLRADQVPAALVQAVVLWPRMGVTPP